jgi:hypothetical protein
MTAPRTSVTPVLKPFWRVFAALKQVEALCNHRCRPELIPHTDLLQQPHQPA